MHILSTKNIENTVYYSAHKCWDLLNVCSTLHCLSTLDIRQAHRFFFWFFYLKGIILIRV